MRSDDAHAQGLRRLLIAAVALLLAREPGRNALHRVEHIQEWIAEKLREHERTHDQAERAGGQPGNRWRIGHRALFKALGGGVQKGLPALSLQLLPGLMLDEAMQPGADASADVALHNLHALAQCRRCQLI